MKIVAPLILVLLSVFCASAAPPPAPLELERISITNRLHEIELRKSAIDRQILKLQSDDDARIRAKLPPDPSNRQRAAALEQQAKQWQPSVTLLQQRLYAIHKQQHP